MTIFQSISQAFQKTPRQALVSVVAVIGLLLVIPIVAVLYRRLSRGRSFEEWEREFQLLIRKKNLTINEIDLLDKLAKFLSEPKRKSFLIKNHNTFQDALTRLTVKVGHPAEYGESLEQKLFGHEEVSLPSNLGIPFGSGEPAHYVAADGRVFAGYLDNKQKNTITIKNVKLLKHREKPGSERLFIQDYHGIATFPISSASSPEAKTLRLVITPTDKLKREKITLDSIYIYPNGTQSPVKTSLLDLDRGIGAIENPDNILKNGDELKVAFKTELNKHYHVNAIVTGLSSNKRVAQLKFGYLKKKT